MVRAWMQMVTSTLYDLEYRFPFVEPNKFIDGQFARFGLNEILAVKTRETQHEASSLRETMVKLFSLFAFSLRTQEQCFTQLAVVLRTTAPNSLVYAHLLVLLICLRVVNRQLYENYVKGDATPDEVMDYIRSVPGSKQFVDSHEGYVTEAHLIVGIRDWQKRKAAKDAHYALANPPTPPGIPISEKPKSDRAKEVIHHFEWVGRYSQDMVGYLYKKIELAQRFVSPAS